MRRLHGFLLFGPAVLLLMLYGVLGLGKPSDPARSGPEIQAADIRVIDGDTIAWNGTNYRLLGFDAPETRQAACEAERAMGEAATAMLRSMILEAKRIEIIAQARKDRYGRGLAHLLADGEDVGDRLISQKLAHPYDGKKARQPWCGRHADRQ